MRWEMHLQCRHEVLRGATVRSLALYMFLTVMVTTTSCIANDYYDWKLGADPALGARPDHVRLALKAGYAVLLTANCFVESATARLFARAGGGRDQQPPARQAGRRRDAHLFLLWRCEG